MVLPDWIKQSPDYLPHLGHLVHPHTDQGVPQPGAGQVHHTTNVTMQQISKAVIILSSSKAALLVLDILPPCPSPLSLYPSRKGENIPTCCPNEDGCQLPGQGGTSQLAYPMPSHQVDQVLLYRPSAYSPE